MAYQRCADASVIQQTLDASTEATVASLESALAEVRLQKGQRHELYSLGHVADTCGYSTFIPMLIGKRT